MTNASCADCGRIVAFRTHDPAEIAECRNCGTWVKRTVEMPGVAVRIDKGTAPNGSNTNVRTAQLPPRKTISPTPAEPAATPPQVSKKNSDGEEMISASAVYAAIRELQKAVISLQDGQKILLERTLPVPDMPSPDSARTRQTPFVEQKGPMVEAAPLTPSSTAISHFYTTRFSSLKVPMIPASLEELGTSKEFTDEELGVEPIPQNERSNLTQLIHEPLPEPEPAPAPEAPFAAEQASSAPVPQAWDTTPFADSTNSDFASLEDSSSQELPPTGPSSFVQEPSEELAEPEAAEGASILPFESKNPFAAEPSDSPVEPPVEKTSPFAYPLKPAGVAHPIDDPFSTNIEEGDPSVDEAPSEDEESVTTSSPFFTTGEPPHPPQTANLATQIAAAKSNQDDSPEQPVLEQRGSEELWTEPRSSKKGIVVAALLALLAGLAAFLFINSDTFKGGKNTADSDAKPPLLELPKRGTTLPEDDPQVKKAREIADLFLEVKNSDELTPLILPVDTKLIDEFYEPLPATFVIRYYQGRVLPSRRVEVDFLVKGYGQAERLLPLVKEDGGEFLVDWKTFAEVEEITLLSLAQGTLILLDGSVAEEGTIRSYVHDEEKNAPQLDNDNWQSFRLLNLTEEVVAHAVVRKDKPEYQELTTALASTELKHNGEPAIRAILRVKKIYAENQGESAPARLEILDVISTTWNQEEEAETPSAEEASKPEAEQETEASPAEPGEELPPVPAETEPLG